MYTPDPTMVSFYQASIEPTVMALVVHKNFPLPKIQERYNLNEQQIIARYGKNTAFNLADKNCRAAIDSGVVMMGCSYEDDNPSIAIFMPAFQKYFGLLRTRNSTTLVEDIETTIIISLLHETDHLALGLIAGKDDCAHYNIEQRVWADTCEYTLRPLVEDYSRKISDSDKVFYDAWLKCGKKADSQQWRSSVRKIYRKVTY